MGDLERSHENLRTENNILKKDLDKKNNEIQKLKEFKKKFFLGNENNNETKKMDEYCPRNRTRIKNKVQQCLSNFNEDLLKFGLFKFNKRKIKIMIFIYSYIFYL